MKRKFDLFLSGNSSHILSSSVFKAMKDTLNCAKLIPIHVKFGVLYVCVLYCKFGGVAVIVRNFNGGDRSTNEQSFH